MAGLLAGKVAIVTGAGHGIGRAHALRLAAEGARVVVNDLGGPRDGSGRDPGAAERVAAEIRAAGGEAVANTDSVAEEAGAARIVGTARDAFGRLDILVNNAGILRDKTLRKMTVEMFDAVMAVHARGTFLCMRDAARVMVEQGQGGRIINTSSVSGLIGNFGQLNYAAAKAAIYGMTRVAHLELFDKHRITVNALAPVAYTRMTEDIPLVARVPDAERALAPEHIADVAAFLASDLAATISGEVVGCEGGRVWLYRMAQTEGVRLPPGERWTPQALAQRWEEIAA